MLEGSRYLCLAGALPFVVLGLAHVVATPLTTAQVLLERTRGVEFVLLWTVELRL